MKIVLSAILALIATSEVVWATPVAAPGPEISGGIMGIMTAAGALYLVSRRKRR